MGAAQLKLTGGVDVAFDLVPPHAVLLENRLNDFGAYQSTQLGLGVTTPFRTMLGAQHHVFDMQRAAIFVGHGHLAFGIWTEVRNGSGPAHFGLSSHQRVGQIDGKRHELFGFAAGVAKHQPLVTGPAGINAPSDVSTLRVQSDLHLAGATIEPFVGVVVANPNGGLSSDGFVIRGLYPSGQADFSGENKDIGAAEGFAGHAGVGVTFETCIQDGVGNGVGQLVGVSFGNRFRGKGPAAGGHANSVGSRRGNPFIRMQRIIEL